MRFSLSWDRTTKIVSGVCCGLMLALALWLHLLPLTCIAVLIPILAYAYSPRSYTVSDGSITVHRPIGNVVISLAGLRAARRATPEDLRGCIKVFGSGGMCGYYGLYRTSALGMCSWYATNRKNLVVLIGAKTALFSPDDVDGFMAAVGAPAAAEGGPVVVAASSRRIQIALGMAFGAAVLSAIGFALSYSPGPPAFTLANGALTIHDRFYPVTLRAGDVDAAHLSVIDLSRDTEWRPTMRTNGFANYHYRSGWFRAANGQKVRLYQASSKRLVLLPGKGGSSPVLLQVQDPEHFIEEVKRALG